GGLITVTPADTGFPNAHFGRDPDVAMDAAGDFVVSFTKLFGSPFGIGDNTQTDVFARRYDSSGSFRQEINVSNRSAFTYTAGNSSVAMSPDGRFDIAYENIDFTPSLSETIRVARFSANGGRFEEQAVAGGNNRVVAPSLSMDKFGDAVIAYQKFVHTDFDI